MKQKITRSLMKRITAFFLVFSMVLGLGAPGMPGGAFEAYGEEVNPIVTSAFVSNFSGQDNNNYASNGNLIIGKGRHTYIRFDMTKLTLGEEDKAVLKLPYAKSGDHAFAFIVKPCSEYLRDGNADSTDTWTKENIKYNNRPLDLEGAQDYQTEEFVPNTQKPLVLDIAGLLRWAQNQNMKTLSLHITSSKVDDSKVNAAEYTNSPYLEVTKTETEPSAPVEPQKREANYWDSGLVSQKVFRMKGEDGKYLKLVDDESGRFTVTDNGDEAAVFSLYVFDYTAKEDATYAPTTYGIKCLTNGRYLSLQNYFGPDDEDKTYWNTRDYGLEIQAEAEDINWNERFYIEQYETSGTYSIKAHYDLNGNRDAGADRVPVRMGDQLYATTSMRGVYKFTFEDVSGQDPLEVIQKKDGDNVILSWYPVNGDKATGNYSVEGATVAASGDGNKLQAVLGNLSDGENLVTVSHTGGAEQEVKVRKFTHPGIMHSQEELDAMKEHIGKKEEPWYSDYLKLRDTVPSNMANPNFATKALAGVGRGNPAGSGNIEAFEQSGNAAYFNALQWVVTGEEAYAKKTVEILNDWANTLKIVDGRDRILGAAINSCRFINAAEIVKYYGGGYSGYSDADFKKFQDMLINVIYPVIEDLAAPMAANGNWDTASMISMISIGVVCDNSEIYNRAVSLYHDIHVNGSIDVYVSDWGQSVESMRDQAHAQLGIGYMADLCMVDKHQGGNLYSLFDNRLAKAFNWAAQYNLYNDEVKTEPLMNVFGDSKRGYWTSMDSDQINRGELRPVYEVPLALYAGTDADLTWTQKAAQAMRAQGYVHNDNLNFGTMTAYSGEVQEEACEPYFQIRTRLEPWYQRKKADVNKYGTPDENSPYETLNSYFTISSDGELVASSKKITAPYFQLVRNEDDTYAIKCVLTGLYLSVKDEKVGDANVIKADAQTIGPNEKFNYKATGAARYFLSSPAYENRLVYVYAENTTDPHNAVLTMRLGPNKETSISALKNNEILNIYYNTEEAAKENATSELLGIELTSLPSRTLYKTGEELDTTGLVVLAKGKNGLNNIVSEDGYTLSKWDSSKEGRQVVTVSVKDPESQAVHEATFTVEFDDNYIGRVQAEDFSKATGHIYIRNNGDAVPGTDSDLFLEGADRGRFIDFSDPVAASNDWNNGIPAGQDTATWKIEVPQTGFYRVAFRYNNPATKWDGNRNARDERNCRIVVNSKDDVMTSGNKWVGWMIFNVSGYSSASAEQSTTQNLSTVGGNTRWNTNYMNMWLEAGENELTLAIEAPPGQGVYDGPNLDCFDIVYVGDEYAGESEIPYIDEGFRFNHPGIYYTMEDLEAMKAGKDQEGTLYNKGFEQLQSSKYAKKDYQVQLTGDTYDVGPYNNPKIQADQFNRDMMASHYNALMWYLTGDKEHAKKSIEILNNMVETVKNIGNGNDVLLRIPLVGIEAINAAEILKHVYNESPDVTEEERWQPEKMEAFDTYVREKLLAKTQNFYPQANGNWDALIGTYNMAVAIYLEDVELFNKCLTQFYLGNAQGGNTASMGSMLSYIYESGEAQESSRDQNHVEMGLTGLAHQCNIAWNQGLDMFEAYDGRLLKGVVYHALYNMGEDVDSVTFISDKKRGETHTVFEIVYQHYKHYGNGISQEDLDILQKMVENEFRGEGRQIKNEVGENWNWYLAMLFSREGREAVVWEEGISLKQEPVKKLYTQGEELDLTGIQIILTNNKGVTTVIDPSDCEISGFDPETIGAQTVVIRYTNSDGKVLETTFTVEVLKEQFYTRQINVTKKPTKTSYYVGEEFDPVGMEVTAEQKATVSNATREVPLKTEDLNFEYDFGKADDKAEVKVIYEEEDDEGELQTFTATVKVKVEEEPEEEKYYVSRIKITSKPKKLIYQPGEDFDPEGLKVTAVLDPLSGEGGSKEQLLDLDSLDFDYDFSQPGKKTVKIRYAGLDKNQEGKMFTVTLEVTVAEPAQEGFYTEKIAITTKPDKMTYQVGDAFDPTGMVVTAYQVNMETGETEEEEIENYQIAPKTLMTEGTCTITVSYASTDKDGEAKMFKDTLEVQVEKAGTKPDDPSKPDIPWITIPVPEIGRDDLTPEQEEEARKQIGDQTKAIEEAVNKAIRDKDFVNRNTTGLDDVVSKDRDVELRQTVEDVETEAVVTVGEDGTVTTTVLIKKLVYDVSLYDVETDEKVELTGNTKKIHFPIVLPNEGIDPKANYVKATHKGDVTYSDMKQEGQVRYTMIETTSFSPFVLEFAPSKPAAGLRNSRGRSAASAKKTDTSKWVQDSVGWWYKKADGTWPADCWIQLAWNGTTQWYRFNKEGYMVTGWYQDTDGSRYYLHDVSDGSQGYMYTGWHEISGNWYYFRENGEGPLGSLLVNGTTPDGYTTDAQGVWIK